jgi:trigger factor
MQVTQTSAEGLKRQFRITVPASEIDGRVNSRLQRLQRSVRMPGFRPGKAPLPLLKKQYGRSIMGEILEEAVDEGAKRAVGDNELRPALRPKVEVESFDEGQDLLFRVDLEILPEVPAVDLESIELTRLAAEPDEARVEEALQRLARARQEFEPPALPRPASLGDRLTIDFEGKIGGEAFTGGQAADFKLVLGQGSMVPGFEDQLVGAALGDRREVKVTFPDSHAAGEVAGKEALFTVDVKAIEAPLPLTVDDAWAKTAGAEGLDDLKGKLRQRFVEEYKGVSRAKLKRALLDHLAATYRFEVPPGMVELEFESIWKQLTDEMKQSNDSFGEGDKSEEAVRGEYRDIAERRVRLGLLLSDVGSRNEVRVENEELQQAVFREAMRFPGQERQVLDYFRKNQGALEQLRAPLFEDKVCDLIFERAKVSERQVPVEELLRDPDDEAPTDTERGAA